MIELNKTEKAILKKEFDKDLKLAEKIVKKVREEDKKTYEEFVAQLEKFRKEDYENYLKAIIYMFTKIEDEEALNQYTQIAVRHNLEEFFGIYIKRVLKHACT